MLAALLLFGASAECWPQAAEYQVKAAFLYKFLNYVEWPQGAFARPDSALVIGVFGADLLAGELTAAVAGRSVSGHPLLVRKLQPGDSAGGLHALFVGAAGHDQVSALLASARGQPVLVVTESSEAFAEGGIVNFVMVDNKVRFDVSLPSAERGNLKISSRLLSVARKVLTGPS